MGTPWGEFIPRADLYLPQKGMDISMKKWKIAGLFAMALMMSVTPLQAFATSPEFAYTAEKWASLQDNKLEYGEIADLIHEYNTTVRQNELDYQKYKGKTSTDIAKEYYDSASEVSERISYPDDDSANYAGQIAQALNSEISVDNLTEQGDNNVDDGEIKRLGYEQAEKSIVQQAQKLMISYYSGKASLDTLEDAVTQAETTYTQAQTRKSAGMTLQSEVDNAAEAVTNAIIHGYDEKDGIVTMSGSIEDDTVTFSVSDDGVGIPDISRAREPLFTGKPEMERSGMGFTIMETFMDSIEVQSEVGKGTRITMTKKLK